jgi:hypothetical protein
VAGEGGVAQIIHTHVSKCKNDKIKLKLYIYIYTHIYIKKFVKRMADSE